MNPFIKFAILFIVDIYIFWNFGKLFGFLGLGIILYRLLNTLGLIRSPQIYRGAFSEGIVYLKDYQGSYRNPEPYKEVSNLIKNFKLKDFQIIGIFYDKPGDVPEEKLRSSIGIYRKNQGFPDPVSKELESYFTVSILLITSGSIISGLDDFTYDLVGYIVVFINNALSVIYAKVSEKFRKKNGISNVKLLIYNSFLITPFLLVLIIISGEGNRLLLYLEKNKDNNLLGLYLGLLSSCILCLILNSSYFFSNEKNSSLFTQLFGNCRDILVTGLSMITLRDFVPTFKTIFGLVLSTFGALFFSMKSMIKNMKFSSKTDEKKKQ